MDNLWRNLPHPIIQTLFTIIINSGDEESLAWLLNLNYLIDPKYRTLVLLREYLITYSSCEINDCKLILFIQYVKFRGGQETDFKLWNSFLDLFKVWSYIEPYDKYFIELPFFKTTGYLKDCLDFYNGLTCAGKKEQHLHTCLCELCIPVFTYYYQSKGHYNSPDQKKLLWENFDQPIISLLRKKRLPKSTLTDGLLPFGSLREYTNLNQILFNTSSIQPIDSLSRLTNISTLNFFDLYPNIRTSQTDTDNSIQYDLSYESIIEIIEKKKEEKYEIIKKISKNYESFQTEKKENFEEEVENTENRQKKREENNIKKYFIKKGGRYILEKKNIASLFAPLIYPNVVNFLNEAITTKSDYEDEYVKPSLVIFDNEEKDIEKTYEYRQKDIKLRLEEIEKSFKEENEELHGEKKNLEEDIDAYYDLLKLFEPKKRGKDNKPYLNKVL